MSNRPGGNNARANSTAIADISQRTAQRAAPNLLIDLTWNASDVCEGSRLYDIEPTRGRRQHQESLINLESILGGENILDADAMLGSVADADLL